MAPMSSWSRPPAASGARCRTKSRARSRRCWPTCPGAGWPGGTAPRALSRHGSRPPACGSVTARPGRTTATCRVTVEGTALDGLVGEWRSNGERKYYLSNLPPRTSLRALAAAIKARWVCEQGHQQLKQELGLGHFEGRSWTGLHRHALMTCMAFAYLQHLRLAGHRPTGPGENAASCSGTATIPEPAGRAPRHHGAAVRRLRRANQLPAL